MICSVGWGVGCLLLEIPKSAPEIPDIGHRMLNTKLIFFIQNFLSASILNSNLLGWDNSSNCNWICI
jgi:hypothetical protein